MSFVERCAYGFGRVIGTVANEVVRVFRPDQFPKAPDEVYAKELPSLVKESDWLNLAVPAIAAILLDHEYVDMPGFRPEVQARTCSCLVRSGGLEMNVVEWVEHISRLIAGLLAYDPAAVIAAIWDYELESSS